MLFVIERGDRDAGLAAREGAARTRARDAGVKILMVSEDLPGERIGGLGKHVVTLVNALLAHGPRGGHPGPQRPRRRTPAPPRSGFDGRFIPGFDYRPARAGRNASWACSIPLKRPFFAPQDRSRHQRPRRRLRRGALPRPPADDRACTSTPRINFVQTRHDQGSECLTHLRFRAGEVCTTATPRDCSACIWPGAGPLRTVGHGASRCDGYRHASAACLSRATRPSSCPSSCAASSCARCPAPTCRAAA